jgi:hypothetical protein
MPSFFRSQYLTLYELFTNGYVMGCVVLIASLAQGTFSQASTHLVNIEGIHLKAALQVRKANPFNSRSFIDIFAHRMDPQALVYAKSLRLAPWSFDQPEQQKESDEHQTNGEELSDSAAHSAISSADPGAITNLMSEDAYNVMSCVWIGHYVWAIPLKVLLLYANNFLV